MENVITVGKRLLPVGQIALVEPFDPSSNPDFKPAKEFKARVVLLNRDIVLTETPPEAFAAAQGWWRPLAPEETGASPATGTKWRSAQHLHPLPTNGAKGRKKDEIGAVGMEEIAQYRCSLNPRTDCVGDFREVSFYAW
jgi:hypothetical protein